jgi:uncharacterized membrane protein HdeD (DUF308 family)
MFNLNNAYRFLELFAIFFAVLSIIFLFFNNFFSVFFAGISAVISSIGMMIYLNKARELDFSKLLFYSLLLSSVPLLIVFFKFLKF